MECSWALETFLDFMTNHSIELLKHGTAAVPRMTPHQSSELNTTRNNTFKRTNDFWEKGRLFEGESAWFWAHCLSFHWSRDHCSNMPTISLDFDEFAWVIVIFCMNHRYHNGRQSFDFPSHYFAGFIPFVGFFHNFFFIFSIFFHFFPNFYTWPFSVAILLINRHETLLHTCLNKLLHAAVLYRC